jgi:hypothetical protein
VLKVRPRPKFLPDTGGQASGQEGTIATAGKAGKIMVERSKIGAQQAANQCHQELTE